MTEPNKNKSCHSEHGHHKGHRWMMIVCVLLMIVVPVLTLTSNISSFNLSILGTALLPMILCLAMHGVMMKLMMSGSKKGQDSSAAENSDKIEATAIAQKANSNSKFNA